ncbi:Trypsin [Metarhizium anisopliae]|nr:Trypsin [Metarhizium anisopliae]
MTDDIAIFKLSEAIPESSSIGYAKVRQQGADPPAQANATIVGCGAQSLWADRAAFPLKLQKARATIVDRNACREQVPGVTESTICVGASAGPGLAAPRPPGLFDWTGGSAMPKQAEARGVCSGDSGGPVVVNGEVYVKLRTGPQSLPESINMSTHLSNRPCRLIMTRRRLVASLSYLQVRVLKVRVLKVRVLKVRVLKVRVLKARVLKALRVLKDAPVAA